HDRSPAGSTLPALVSRISHASPGQRGGRNRFPGGVEQGHSRMEIPCSDRTAGGVEQRNDAFIAAGTRQSEQRNGFPNAHGQCVSNSPGRHNCGCCPAIFRISTGGGELKCQGESKSRSSSSESAEPLRWVSSSISSAACDRW